MKKILLAFVMLFPCLVHGQVETKNSLSLQLQVGSQGVGADFRYGVLPNLSLRAGASFIPVNVNGVYDISGFDSQNDLTAKFSNIHLLADFVPFSGAQGFRLVGGVGYLFKANGGLSVTPSGTYKYGDISLTPEQVGSVNVDIDWKGVAPYLGFGLFKSFPNNRFNINLDLGTYYLTTPKTTIVGTGMLSSNDSQTELINSNVKDYRFLPVIQFNFNFKLK